tara:strand:+ start:158067 stop:158519 length:453 start_codon:yes stop_codon:yes gene_type:complete
MSKEKKQEAKPQFAIQRLYVKDLSFEAPNTPNVFKEEWKPEINLDLNTKHEKLEDNTYEVVLKTTVTAKKGEKTLFVAEVHQAGIFTAGNFEEGNLGEVLGAFCPNVLFPYAREVLSDVVNRGGFPPLYLAPINFDAIYAESKKQAAEAK